MNQQPLTSLSKSIFLICSIFILVSCNSSNTNDILANGSLIETEVILSEPPPVNESLAISPPPKDVLERKLVKKGTLVFETTDLLKTREHIEQAIKKHKGYISSEKENKYREKLDNTLVIRIPVQQFDKFINDALRGVDRLDTKDIQIKDVTEEFLDIQARLRTKKELEQRYRELLKKATKVSEMLEIEKQIGDLRADIESIEIRLQYLNSQSTYSTVSITYYKSIPTQTAFGNKFNESFANGWNNLVAFVIGLINIWPFLLLITGFISLLRYWWKKRK